MYTDDLLEEKYRAQRQLSKDAEKANQDYLEFVEAEVKALFEKNGWKRKISKRKGGFLSQEAQKRQTN